MRKQDVVHLSSIQMVGLSGIQMAFENQTIWHPTSFRPFEHQASLVFRSPLYNNILTLNLNEQLKLQIQNRHNILSLPALFCAPGERHMTRRSSPITFDIDEKALDKIGFSNFIQRLFGECDT